MQIGLSETSILAAYHQDAVERYNVTCDFPGVIRELTDPHKRFPFQVCRGMQYSNTLQLLARAYHSFISDPSMV